MKKFIRMVSGMVCLWFIVFCCTGCQLTDLLGSVRGESDIEDLIPDLEELEDIAEKAAREAETAEEETIDLATPYIGYLNLKYSYEDDAEAFLVEASFDEKIEFRYAGKGDHTREIYVFLETFNQTQSTNLAALNQGVYCWTTLNHDVKYVVSGTFNPATCEVVLTNVSGVAQKSEITKTECPAVVLTAIVPELSYIPPPTVQNFKLAKPNTFFLIGDHLFMVSDIYLPTEEMTCPTK